MTELSPNAHQPYRATDSALLQYGYWECDGFCFRGPPPVAGEEGRRVAFIGAAQTFGRFAQAPYPTLVGERLARPILNLGYAGAGPVFFTTKPGVLALAEESAAVVVQVLSGRSVSNSLFEAMGGRNLYRRTEDLSRLGEGEMFAELQALPEARRRALIEETQRNWVEQMLALLEAIKAPKLLLWFASRSPTDSGRNMDGISLGFPHLVTAPMMQEVRRGADAYLECVTDRGLPQTLRHPTTGEPVPIRFAPNRVSTVNSYYPSPEMHADVATALAAPLAALLGDAVEDAVGLH